MELSQKTKDAVKAFIAKLGIDLPANKVEPVAPVVKLEDVSLIDGTMLSVDKMEVGAMATFTGADGVAVPAEGEFELADGQTVVCAGGVITEIKPKEADDQPEASESEMKTMLSKLSERLDSVEKMYQETLAAKTTLEAQLKETKNGLAVALSAIDEFNTAAVAVSLEAQKSTKKDINYTKLNAYQKYQLEKYGEVKY